MVNAADYILWRNTLNQIGIGLPADGTGATPGVPDGVVDQLDYAFWKTHYGDTIPGGGSSLADGAANVPEPSALLLLAIGWTYVCLGRLSTRGQNMTGRG